MKCENLIFSYKLEKSKSSFDTISINGKYVHSKYYPENERDIQKYQNNSLISIFGIGLGYFAESVIEANISSLFIIYEPFSELLDLFISKISNSAFYGKIKDNIVFLKRIDINSIYNFIDKKKFCGEGRIHFLSNPVYKNLFYSKYIDFTENIKKSFELHIQNTLTKSNFIYLWSKNFSLNSINFTRIPILIQEKSDKIDDLAVIVCAGPTLSEQVGILKKHTNKITIFAVDTAVKTLLEEEIIPDFIITLDGQHYSLDDFPNKLPNQSIIIADIVSYPEIIRKYHNLYFIFTNNLADSTIISYFFDYHAITPSGIDVSGTVSDLALKFVIKAGFKHILFLGLDLSYPNLMTHCVSTPIFDRLLRDSNYFKTLETQFANIITNRNIRKIISKNEKPIFSDFVLENYAQNFNSLKDDFPDISFYNSMTNGYNIKNFENVDTNIFLSEFDSKRHSDDILENFKKITISCSQIRDFYFHTIDELYEFSESLKNNFDNENFDNENPEKIEKWFGIYDNIDVRFPFLKNFTRMTEIILSRKKIYPSSLLFYKHTGYKILQSTYYLIRLFQKTLKIL